MLRFHWDHGLGFCTLSNKPPLLQGAHIFIGAIGEPCKEEGKEWTVDMIREEGNE
jgi:hypothetical protein